MGTYSLTVLEVRSLTSKCGQAGLAPPEAMGQHLARPLSLAHRRPSSPWVLTLSPSMCISGSKFPLLIRTPAILDEGSPTDRILTNYIYNNPTSK